jgi:NCAIR mutase (PurE)-related protein
MEIINDISSQSFTSVEEMKVISSETSERKKVERKQYVRKCCDDILYAQSNQPAAIIPERETIIRKKTEVLSTTVTDGPERAYKPRKKQDIF